MQQRASVGVQEPLRNAAPPRPSRSLEGAIQLLPPLPGVDVFNHLHLGTAQRDTTLRYRRLSRAVAAAGALGRGRRAAALGAAALCSGRGPAALHVHRELAPGGWLQDVLLGGGWGRGWDGNEQSVGQQAS